MVVWFEVVSGLSIGCFLHVVDTISVSGSEFDFIRNHTGCVSLTENEQRIHSRLSMSRFFWPALSQKRRVP